MLYLHCGWPRTSTTSLQHALAAHREELAMAGVVYPERWIAGGDSHHGLVQFLNESLAGEEDIDDFKRLLADHDGNDIVFSVEAISYWVRQPDRREALLKLLAAARDVTHVTCVWTLRRFDEILVSLYLLWLALGRPPVSVDDFLCARPSGERLIRGLRELDEALGDACVYFQYRSGGAHNRDFIRLLGLPPDLATKLERHLDRGPRLNPRLTQKQAVICLNIDLFSSRLGFNLDRNALRNAIRKGEFELAEDAPCELLGTDAKLVIHERALATARRSGFQPYLDYYADADPAPSSPVSLDPGVVTDEDLSRLVDCIRADTT
jgi:hypothetical protein